ncbi:MAG: hypothetical protein ACE5HP_04670 [Gemmatimonadota bacterium]
MEQELYRASVHRLALSPDGKRLAFVEALGPGGPTALQVMPASGGAPREVVRLKGADPMPDRAGIDWSADGRHLLYASRSEAGDDFLLELWRVEADSGEAEKLGLVMEGLGRHGIDLDPDGQRIAFVAGVASIGIWVADALLEQDRR